MPRRENPGQPWRGFDPSAKNRHWAIPGFLAEQMPPEFARQGVLAKLEALYAAGLIEIRPGAAWPTPVRYLRDDDGHPYGDIWAYQPYTNGAVHGTKDGIDADVAWLGPTDPERLGYQTQKPLGLLGADHRQFVSAAGTRARPVLRERNDDRGGAGCLVSLDRHRTEPDGDRIAPRAAAHRLRVGAES